MTTPKAFEKWIAIIFYPLVFVLALVLIFEEWLWEKTLILTRKIAVLPVIRHIEAYFQRLPPYGALVALGLPWLLLLPIKLLAVRLLAEERPIRGVIVLVASKVLGTAVLARIFALTRAAALRISWFNRIYRLILFLLSWAKTWLRSSKAYQVAHARLLAMKDWWRARRPGFLGRTFRAQLKLRRNDFKKKP